jgi:hypothetical protein
VPKGDPDYVLYVEMDADAVKEELVSVERYITKLGESGIKRFEQIGNVLRVTYNDALKQVRATGKAYNESMKGVKPGTKQTPEQKQLLENLINARKAALGLQDTIEAVSNILDGIEPIQIAGQGFRTFNRMEEDLFGDIGKMGAESLVRKINGLLTDADPQIAARLQQSKAKVEKLMERFLDLDHPLTAKGLIKGVDKETRNLEKYLQASLGSIRHVEIRGDEIIDIRFDELAEKSRKALGDIQALNLSEQIANVIKRGVPEVQDAVLDLKAKLDLLSAPGTAISGKEYLAQLREIRTQVEAFAGVEPPELISLEQEARVNQLSAVYRIFEQTAKTAFDAADEEGRQHIETLQKLASVRLSDAALTPGDEDKAIKALQDLTAKARTEVKGFPIPIEPPGEGEIEQALIELRTKFAQLDQAVEETFAGGNTMAKAHAREIQNLAGTYDVFATDAGDNLDLIKNKSKELNAQTKLLKQQPGTFPAEQNIDDEQYDEAFIRLKTNFALVEQLAGKVFEKGNEEAKQHAREILKTAGSYEIFLDSGELTLDRLIQKNKDLVGEQALLRKQISAYPAPPPASAAPDAPDPELRKKQVSDLQLQYEATGQAIARATEVANEKGQEHLVILSRWSDQAYQAGLTEAGAYDMALKRMRESESGAKKVISLLAQVQEKGIAGPSKPAELISAEQQTSLNTVNRLFAEIKDRATELYDTLSDEGKRELDAISETVAEYEKYSGALQLADRNVKELVPDLNNLNAQSKKVVASYKEIRDVAGDALKGIKIQITTKEAENSLKRLNSYIDELSGSTKQGAQESGRALKAAADIIVREYNQGNISLEQFNAALNESIGIAKRAGDAYDMSFKIDEKVNRGRVSIWKLGSALDRVGVRGAGSMINIVDAIKSLGPVAIGAGVAIGGILLIVNQVVQALTELAKRAAEAFYQFTKGAVATSQAIEVTDKQLGGLIDNMKLGPAFRDFLLEKSFDVGLDLTGNFARVAVPLAASTQEILDMANAAATLAHAFQETDESIANAIKQATGGHYRPLIELFGFTNAEIQNMKEAQETGTQLGGVLQGIQDFLSFRGLSLNEMRSTFQVLLGQLNVVRKEIEITFGDPVKEALAQQLRDLFDIVEENHDVIVNFFEAMGDAVASIVTKIGGVIQDLIGDVTDEDIVALRDQLDELTTSIGTTIDQVGILLKTEDKNFVDILINATDAANGLAIKLGELLQVLDGINNILHLGGFTETPFFRVAKEVALSANIVKTFGNTLVESIGFLGKFASAEGASREEGRHLLETGLEMVPVVGQLIAAYKEITEIHEEDAEATRDLTTETKELTDANEELSESLRGLIDDALGAAQALQQLEELEAAAAEAAEKIAEAEDKLERDRRNDEAEKRTKYARDEIVAQQKLSLEKEEMFRKHMNKMQELNFDFHADNAAALLDFDRKEEDIYIKHTDKLTDIDREEAEKKIDIEKKFRERLEDIRRRFDLQAEEAIRKNDAVSLLRIRRQMRAELEEAVVNRDREIEAAADTAQKKRDEAAIWLEREIRDNNLAESRKLADLITADQLKRDEMARQFAWEQSELFKKYDEERALAEQAHNWEMEDLEETYRIKKEELTFQLADEYALVKEWQDKETEYVKMKYLELQRWFRAQRQLFIQEGGLARAIIDGMYDTLPDYDLDDLVNGGGVSGRTEDEGDNDYRTPPGGGRGRQYGGFVTPGRYYNVGERGPERFMPVQAGLIAPHQPYMMSSRGSNGMFGGIDNSRHLNADITLSDPSQMTPMQRAVIRSIIVEDILSYGL